MLPRFCKIHNGRLSYYYTIFISSICLSIDLNHDLNPRNDVHFHENEEAITERALKTVGLKPSVKHDGSIKELINSNNENDLELANVAMNYHQVRRSFY